MKGIILIISLLIIPYFVQAFNFVYINNASVNKTNFNNCESMQISITGDYSDPCAYHPGLGDSVKIIGNTMYVYMTTRNISCDSGAICLAVIVPMSTNFSIGIPANANGNYNLVLVSQNVCPLITPSVSNDSVNIGVITVVNSASTINTLLNSNVGANINVGDPINYSFTTTAPNTFTVNWFRNSVLSFSANNVNTWSTSLQSNLDSVFAVLSFSIDSCAGIDTSNTIYIKASANKIGDKVTNQWQFSKQQNNIIFNGLNSTYNFIVFGLDGRVIKKGFINKQNNIMQLPEIEHQLFIIQLFNDAENYSLKIIK